MASRLALLFLFAAYLQAADLRIGVLSLFRPERVTVRSTQVLQIQAGPRLVTLAPGQVAGMLAAGPEIDLFAQQLQSSAPKVTVTGRGGAPVAFDLKIEGKIDRKFVGRLEVTSIGSRLEPIVLVDIESAVSAIVAAEMPKDAPMEALKAMAVLARSFYVAGGRRHGAYDFCDTTHCQWRREAIAPDHPAALAAAATSDTILTYDGRPIAAMYHASCGGRTKSAADVGLPVDRYPYFPVDCDICKGEAQSWIRKLPAGLLKSPTESQRLEVVRKLGWDALPSNNYASRTEGDSLIINGRGEGHGVGVCQRGLIGYARDGADFRAMLNRYLPQTRTTGRQQ